MPSVYQNACLLTIAETLFSGRLMGLILLPSSVWWAGQQHCVPNWIVFGMAMMRHTVYAGASECYTGPYESR
jgi:hypothetical protein